MNINELDINELDSKIDNFVILKNNKKELSPSIEQLIDRVMKYKDDVEMLEKKLREAILMAMINNNISSSKLGKYNISQVIPKDKISFNAEEFILNESEDIVKNVSSIEIKETFDVDRFKEENKDIYNKYLNKEFLYKVDDVKLSKFLPDIYNKYVTKSPSNKPITLRIQVAK